MTMIAVLACCFAGIASLVNHKATLEDLPHSFLGLLFMARQSTRGLQQTKTSCDILLLVD